MAKPSEMSDLKRAYNALRDKQGHHNERWDYYEGRHPIRFSSKKLQDFFGVHWRHAQFTENWLAAIVATSLDRLQIERLDVPDDEAASELLSELAERMNLEIEMEDVFLDALVTGEGYLVVWQAESREPEAYHNDSRAVHIWTDPENPRRTAMGAKWWHTDDEKTLRINLYYPDRIEYWQAKAPAKGTPMPEFKAGAWTRVDEPGATGGVAQNPYGQVPIFCFEISRHAQGEMDRGIPVQDGINKMISDLTVAADYACAPQRWAVTNASFGGKPPLTGNSLLEIPAGEKDTEPTQIGVFPAADTGNFLSVIEQKAKTMAAITQTPYHFFFSGAGGVPSGEALIALEAPLNRKIQRYQRRLGATLTDVARFALAVAGSPVAPETLIVANWLPAETVQPLTRATIRQTNVQAGIPLITQLRDEGWTDEEIDQMLADGRMAGQGQPLADPDTQVIDVDARAAAAEPNIEAAVAEAVTLISDGLLDQMAQSGALDRIVAARSAQ